MGGNIAPSAATALEPVQGLLTVKLFLYLYQREAVFPTLCYVCCADLDQWACPVKLHILSWFGFFGFVDFLF